MQSGPYADDRRPRKAPLRLPCTPVLLTLVVAGPPGVGTRGRSGTKTGLASLSRPGAERTRRRERRLSRAPADHARTGPPRLVRAPPALAEHRWGSPAAGKHHAAEKARARELATEQSARASAQAGEQRTREILQSITDAFLSFASDWDSDAHELPGRGALGATAIRTAGR